MNPYLQQQTQAVTDQATQNWRQNMLPSINSGSLANNNFGSNRHAIAQGVGMANMQTGLNNTIANMNMGAWESDQNRAHQAGMQQAALAQQSEMARMQDATQRLGLGNQFTLGLGNLGLGYTQAGQNYNLGLGNLGLGFQNSANQFSLGQQQNQTQRDLGFGNLGLGFQNSANQFALGQQQNQNQRQQIDNSFNLGQQAQNTNQFQAQTQRDLGFGAQDFNYWNAGNQFGLQNQAQNQNFYSNQRAQDLQQMGLGANLMNQGNLGLSNAGQGMFGIGQQQFNQGFQPFQQFGSLLGQFSGMGGQNSTTQPGGSTLGGAIGGAMTLAQLWQLLGGGKP